jgi:SAM-dependent methyltransferase
MNRRERPVSSYSSHFFDRIQEGAVRSAREVVPLLLEWVRPASVVDVGCGNGTWLSVFREAGVKTILGLDGDYVDQNQLLIPREFFQPADLANPPSTGARFDLVVSLEVAEHLPEEAAARFVAFLTGLGPVVAFSAAIPHQRGTHHVNEQWPGYWAGLFRERGFTVVDALRDRLWTNDAVEWWYAQNLLLFVRDSALAQFPALARAAEQTRGRRLDVVHPKAYATWVDECALYKQWARRMHEISRDLTAILPAGATFLFVDDGQFEAWAYPPDRRAMPFLERDGQYWGPPADDETALAELSRMIAAGAEYIVVGWLAFWWLEHYPRFAARLRESCRCLHESERLVVFDLRGGRGE